MLFSHPSIQILQHLLLVYFLWINAVYLLQLFVSWVFILRRQKIIEERHLPSFLKAEGLPSITLIVPAFNEEVHIVLMVETLLNIPYGNKQIIVVNDGSTDETMSHLRKNLRLLRVHGAYWEEIPTESVLAFYQSIDHPEVFVIEKRNGGRADAVNAGINASQTDYVIATDADTLIDGLELNRLIRYMMTEPEIHAFGATVRIANNCKAQLRGITEVRYPKGWIAGTQVVEYIRAFLVGRQGWEFFGGPFILSGAFSCYRREDLLRLGGLDPHSLGEDLDITVRYKAWMQREEGDIRTGFLPESIAWTEVPSTAGTLFRQRVRWQIGLLQTLAKMKFLLFNPKYGWLGIFVYPFYLFGEALSPIVEAVGYCLILLAFFVGISVRWILYFLLITWGFTAFMNFACILLEILCFNVYKSWKDIGKLFFYSIVENFGFRQITLLARLKGTWDYLIRRKHVWGQMKREGFFKKIPLE